MTRSYCTCLAYCRAAQDCSDADLCSYEPSPLERVISYATVELYDSWIEYFLGGSIEDTLNQVMRRCNLTKSDFNYDLVLRQLKQQGSPRKGTVMANYYQMT